MTTEDNIVLNGKIPIIIGVTGHRDLFPEDQQSLHESIKKSLKQVQEGAPGTPLVMLTALAEGADSIAAEVAYMMEIPIIATLPMKIDEYAKDFGEGEAKSYFYSLVNKAWKVYEGPYYTKEPLHPEEYAAKRNTYYEEVGLFIIRQCNILIALWDGKVIDKKGGTSHVVKMAQGEIRTSEKPLIRSTSFRDEQCKIYHLKTRRKSNPAVEDLFTVKILEGSDDELSDSEEYYFQYLEEYNKETKHTATEELSSLIPIYHDQMQTPDLECIRSSEQTDIVKHFINFDQLSIKYLGLKIRYASAIMYLVIIGVIFFNLYGFIDSDILLYGYLGMYSMATVAYLAAKKQELNRKSVDYRTISEALRVQLFWNFAGVRRKVENFYSDKYTEELFWMRRGIKTINLLYYDHQRKTHQNSDNAIETSNEQLAAVKEYWVESQLGYFKSSIRKHNQRIRSNSKSWERLFVLGLVMPVILLLTKFTDFIFFQESTHNLMISLTSIFPAIGALVYANSNLRSYKELIKRYQQALKTFNNANKELEACTRRQDRMKCEQDVYLELGKESIEENSEWVYMNRKRDVELPK